MVYLNDIIIYLISKEEYREYIKWVLKRLQKEKMLVVIKKCEFFTRKTNFISVTKPCSRNYGGLVNGLGV